MPGATIRVVTLNLWQEQGPWLLLLITPLAALAFRRGVVLSMLLAVLLLPAPQSSLAQDVSWWDRLWYNKNQLGERALQQGEAQSAAELFEQSDWKAAAHYRAGHYDRALQQLDKLDSLVADYNRANTLARLGQYQQALENYDQVLESDPKHEDAAYNRELVKRALERQQPSQQQPSQQQQDQQQQSQQQQQQSGEQGSPQQNPGQQAQQEPASQTDQEQQDSAESDPQPQSPGQTDQQQPQQMQSAQQQSSQQDAEDESAARRPSVQDEISEQLSQQAQAQWLRRIPDDPGGLLRNKFRYQYSRQAQPSREREPW